MSCEDEDDFDALAKRAWPVEAFVEGEDVVLWKADTKKPVGSGNRAALNNYGENIQRMN